MGFFLGFKISIDLRFVGGFDNIWVRGCVEFINKIFGCVFDSVLCRFDIIDVNSDWWMVFWEFCKFYYIKEVYKFYDCCYK